MQKLKTLVGQLTQEIFMKVIYISKSHVTLSYSACISIHVCAACMTLRQPKNTIDSTISNIIKTEMHLLLM